MKREYRIRKQITLSEEAVRLLEEEHEIKNVSKFLDELIIDHLGQRDSLLKMLMGKQEELRKEFQRINYDVEISLDKGEKKMGVDIKKKKPKETTEKPPDG